MYTRGRRAPLKMHLCKCYFTLPGTKHVHESSVTKLYPTHTTFQWNLKSIRPSSVIHQEGGCDLDRKHLQNTLINPCQMASNSIPKHICFICIVMNFKSLTSHIVPALSMDRWHPQTYPRIMFEVFPIEVDSRSNMFGHSYRQSTHSFECVC